jgi:hypothetical protein
MWKGEGTWCGGLPGARLGDWCPKGPLVTTLVDIVPVDSAIHELHPQAYLVFFPILSVESVCISSPTPV